MVSDIDIGGRLRQVREKAGLSQRALARRAGITNSTISLIEANSMNPSVGALKRILDAIPLALADFFAFEPEVDRRPFFRASDLVEIGKGAISSPQVGRTIRGRMLQILRDFYQPVPARSEEPPGGKEGVSQGRSRWSTNNSKTKN